MHPYLNENCVEVRKIQVKFTAVADEMETTFLFDAV